VYVWGSGKEGGGKTEMGGKREKGRGKEAEEERGDEGCTGRVRG